MSYRCYPMPRSTQPMIETDRLITSAPVSHKEEDLEQMFFRVTDEMQVPAAVAGDLAQRNGSHGN